MLVRRAEEAGYTEGTPHQFRHTFSNGWLDSGGSEGDLMPLNGWKTRAMVDRDLAGSSDGRSRPRAAWPRSARQRHRSGRRSRSSASANCSCRRSVLPRAAAGDRHVRGQLFEEPSGPLTVIGTAASSATAASTAPIAGSAALTWVTAASVAASRRACRRASRAVTTAPSQALGPADGGPAHHRGGACRLPGGPGSPAPVPARYRRDRECHCVRGPGVRSAVRAPLGWWCSLAGYHAVLPGHRRR
jgi:hypothetical protein